MRQSLFSLLAIGFLLFAEPSVGSKARQKALQLDAQRMGFLSRAPGASASEFQVIPQMKPVLPIEKLKVSPGFEIQIFAVVPLARGLAVGDKGQVYAGSRDDKVYRISDSDLNGEAETVEVLLEGLNQPNGVGYQNGKLYVADKTQIRKIENPTATRPAEIQVKPVAQPFPPQNQNNWKFLRFGPEAWLYVNLAVPKEARFHKLNVETEKGGFVGVAPPVWGFDWDPKAQKLWVPTLHMKFPLHLVPLGVRFYTGDLFPSEFKNQVFMVEQGSWDGATPRGNRVSYLNLENGKVISYRPFVEGWMGSGKPWGRPIDVVVHSDGSLLISDDEAGVIYRVNYLLR